MPSAISFDSNGNLSRASVNEAPIGIAIGVDHGAGESVSVAMRGIVEVQTPSGEMEMVNIENIRPEHINEVGQYVGERANQNPCMEIPMRGGSQESLLGSDLVSKKVIRIEIKSNREVIEERLNAI